MVHGVAFSPDGKLIATGSLDQSLKIWDAVSGKELLTLRGHTGEVLDVAFSPDHKFLVSAARDGNVVLWSRTKLGSGEVRPESEKRPVKPVPTAVEIGHFEGHTKEISSVALSPDCDEAATCGWDKTARLWDLKKYTEIRRLRSDDYLTVKYSPVGGRLLTTIASGGLLWNHDSDKVHRQFAMGQTWCESCAFSGDGQRVLLNGLANAFALWNVETGKIERRFADPVSWTHVVALSCDGRLALSHSRGTPAIRLWDVEHGQMLALLCRLSKTHYFLGFFTRRQPGTFRRCGCHGASVGSCHWEGATASGRTQRCCLFGGLYPRWSPRLDRRRRQDHPSLGFGVCQGITTLERTHRARDMPGRGQRWAARPFRGRRHDRPALAVAGSPAGQIMRERMRTLDRDRS